MARLFDDASNQSLTVESAVLTGPPITMACWFNSNDATIEQGLINIVDKDGPANPRWMLQIRGASVGDPIRLASEPSGFASVITTTGYSANTWHHACGIENSQTNRNVYIDGGSKGTDTTDPGAVSGTPDRTAIGRQMDSTPNAPMSGSIAEVGIWNVALTDAEVAVLADGFCPLLVRPQSLVLYVPLIRDADQDIVGGLSFTPNASPTISSHPRIIYPSFAQIRRFGAAAPPAGGARAYWRNLLGVGF